MFIEVSDYNNADEFFDFEGRTAWEGLAEVLTTLPLFLQPSGEAGRDQKPIFDPKATNAALTESAALLGWHKVPVPMELRAFGQDWDAGQGPILAEWQFSNYPFLWNNVIRTEAVRNGGMILPGLDPVEALIVVTKSGQIPASNSTLYYEQARAQLAVVTKFDAFSIPIRLVGLMLDDGATRTDAIWSEYSARYARVSEFTEQRTMDIVWGNSGRHGHQRASFFPAD